MSVLQWFSTREVDESARQLAEDFAATFTLEMAADLPRDRKKVKENYRPRSRKPTETRRNYSDKRLSACLRKPASATPFAGNWKNSVTTSN